jgi:predicted ribosome-associated RNA-binding protein Tma20
MTNMAVEKKGPIGDPQTRPYITGVANVKRGLAVKKGADDSHVVIADANAVCIGLVAEDSPLLAAGDVVSVVTAGETVAQIGAAVAADQFLKSDANGKLIPVAATGDNAIAQAISGNANAGDWITVRVVRFIKP